MKEESMTFAKKGLRIASFAVLGILAAALFALIFAVAVRLLWNWLMPELFGLSTIDYLQALGLVVLARLLVGGWHKGHGDHHSSSHDHLHRFLRSDYGKIPPDIRMNGKEFGKFWEERGRRDFRDFMEKTAPCDSKEQI